MLVSGILLYSVLIAMSMSHKHARTHVHTETDRQTDRQTDRHRYYALYTTGAAVHSITF